LSAIIIGGHRREHAEAGGKAGREIGEELRNWFTGKIVVGFHVPLSKAASEVN
jgi:hypothetical protein